MITVEEILEYLNSDRIEDMTEEKNLTGSDFLKRKDQIVAALDHEIKHGDLNRMAAIRHNKRTL